MSEFATWLDVNIQEQQSFVLGFVCAVAAIVLRSSGVIPSTGAAPIAKLAFNFCFPALLFVKVAKAELKLELWRVALASLCVNGLLVLVVLGLSRFVSISGGFRGQWIFCMMGGNIGFTYPIVLAARHLHNSVFPSLVIWDLAANMEICFIVNFIVAICYAPIGSGVKQATLVVDPETTLEPLPVPDQIMQERHGMEVNAKEASKMQSELTAMDADEHPGLTQAVMGISDIRVAALVASDSSLGVERAATPPTGGIELGLQATSGRSFVMRVILGVLTNVPLVFQSSGLLFNVAGLKLPRAADVLFEAVGQPFSVLFFIVIGMNLSWPTIQKHARNVIVMVSTRTLIHGLLMLIVWILPLMQEDSARKSAFIALCCPIGGITMAFTLDFGFDGGLQAALMSVSNIISFALLLAVMNL